MIEGFVRNRLMVDRAREQTYRVSDEELSRTVREMPVFQVGGQFSMESYRAMLANVGYTPAGFEAEQRQDLQVTFIENTTPSALASNGRHPVDVVPRNCENRQLLPGPGQKTPPAMTASVSLSSRACMPRATE